MDWSWALERARRLGGHLRKAGEGQLRTDNYLGKHIHHAAEGNMVVFPFVCGNVSTRQNLLPGLAPLLCIFTENQGTQWPIERSLLFTSKSGPSRWGLRHSTMGKLSHRYVLGGAVNSTLNSHTCTTFSSEDIKAIPCIYHTIHSISQPLSEAFKCSTVRPIET